MSQQPGDRGNGATEGPFANGLAAQRKGLWKTVFRGVVTVAVVAAVIWTGWKGYLDLRKQEGLSWEQFHWQWLPIASLLYFLGMLPSWGYWHWLLSRSGLTVNLRDSFRAFFMSQLGKYIPGKVMVILIRTAVISHQQVDRDRVTTLRGQHTWITVTATAFMETLTFIAMGGLVGVVAGAGFFSERPWVIGVALLVAAAMCLPILPPVFHFVARKVKLPGGDEGRAILLRTWNWRSFLLGIVLLPVGWMILGSSLWALFWSLPTPTPQPDDYQAALTCVSLANVLGFVSLIPGGFGVREVVMFPILEPRFSLAIVLVILYRMTSLVAESLAGVFAWCLPAGSAAE